MRRNKRTTAVLVAVVTGCAWQWQWRVIFVALRS